MKSQFEIVEVPTTTIRSAYTPTKIQLEGLVEKAIEHDTERKMLHRDKLQKLHKQWFDDYNLYQKNNEDWDAYKNKINNFWNRVLRKKFDKPEVVYHPGPLTEYENHDTLHYLAYREKNPVLELLKECNESLVVCSYSGVVPMTPKQLERVEYFRSGKALQEVQEWFDNKEVSLLNSKTGKQVKQKQSTYTELKLLMFLYEKKPMG